MPELAGPSRMLPKVGKERRRAFGGLRLGQSSQETATRLANQLPPELPLL